LFPKKLLKVLPYHTKPVLQRTRAGTAARDLIQLEQLGVLKRQGEGRSTRYYPAIEGWAESMGGLGVP
jgi:hypothetical protein